MHMPDLLFKFIVFMYGLLIGSFLNAWIWRIHTNRKVSKGRSMCPDCYHVLIWYDLIPLFSWLGLRGKCRYCHKPISIQYPLVELATALLWVALLMAVQTVNLYGWLLYGVWLIVGSLLMAAYVYDAKWMLLPDIFMVPAIVVAAGWLVVRWLVFGQVSLVVEQLVGTTIFAGFFYALWYISKGGWLGDGDIRIALVMGLMLTPVQLVVAIFITFNLGAIVSLGLILFKKKTRKDAIAFGPFLIVGMFSAFFFADSLMSWYLRFLG